MIQKTPLHDLHIQSGARMAAFAGWDLPLHFGSQVEEHHAVRHAAGMFDVSHMSVLDVDGSEAEWLLRALLANDVARLPGAGRGLYSCLLNERGGVIDDLIAYRLELERFRIVSNAASRQRVWDWFAVHAAGRPARLTPRPELAIVAVQGPLAREHVHAYLPEAVRSGVARLESFGCAQAVDWMIARTGYTGEDGYEVILPAEAAADLWQRLLSAGVQPCGLGARDTLRLEAGMRLAGVDMDETVTPLESGLAWTVAFDPQDRLFIGRGALEGQRDSKDLQEFVGLVLVEPGIMRAGYRVRGADGREGRVTSGLFGPTLARSIGFARLPPGIGRDVEIEIRGQWKRARITSPRFLAEFRSPA